MNLGGRYSANGRTTLEGNIESLHSDSYGLVIDDMLLDLCIIIKITLHILFYRKITAMFIEPIKFLIGFRIKK